MYLCTRKTNMVPVVQLVRASDCGSERRGFESHRAPFGANRVSCDLRGLLFFDVLRHGKTKAAFLIFETLLVIFEVRPV